MNLRSIDPAALLVLHWECLDEIDAEVAACDDGLLDAALSYPLAKMFPGTADVAAVAAAHVVGMLKHQPFAVGNVQAAFLAMGLFLYVNDWRLGAPQDEATRIMRQVVSGEVDEEALADWIRSNL